jgi:hypothetical protein
MAYPTGWRVTVDMRPRVDSHAHVAVVSPQYLAPPVAVADLGAMHSWLARVVKCASPSRPVAYDGATGVVQMQDGTKAPPGLLGSFLDDLLMCRWSVEGFAPQNEAAYEGHGLLAKPVDVVLSRSGPPPACTVVKHGWATDALMLSRKVPLEAPEIKFSTRFGTEDSRVMALSSSWSPEYFAPAPRTECPLRVEWPARVLGCVADEADSAHARLHVSLGKHALLSTAASNPPLTHAQRDALVPVLQRCLDKHPPPMVAYADPLGIPKGARPGRDSDPPPFESVQP